MSREIAVVIESLGGGGAQHVVTTLANSWASAGIDVTVITFQGPDKDAFKLEPRIRRMTIGGSKPSRNFIGGLIANSRRIVLLRGALRSCPAATILAFVGSTNILTILAALGLGQRLVISERNDPARQSLGRPWDLLRKMLYRRADLVVANSRAAIATMSEFVPSERLSWLPNMLRVAPAGTNRSIPVANPFFLSVGRLVEQKGYDVLIEAFAQLAAVLPAWQLVILGDGPLLSELKQLAAELSVGDRVHFEGYVENPFPWYSKAEILVHPARFEGLPNAVLEAMSERRPVIVTDAQEGLRDIVVNNESGLVVAVNSVVALSEAMMSLAKDPQLRKRLGSAAYVAVEPFKAETAVQTWTTALGMHSA